MLVSYLLAITAAAATVAGRYIVPGARWLDTDGNAINAHAGNVILDNGTFYWYGEYKIENQTEGAGVSVYSSTDLATWTFHGLALSPSQGGGYGIIQRPKVVYSATTGKYNMWWHADNSTYGFLLQGLATSDTVTGPYTFINATAPLGNWSQDFGLFTDYKSGRSYALYSNGDTVEGRDDYISQYNEDVTAVEEVVFRFDKYDLEAPGIVQTDEDGYYILMSHKTGYRPNDVVAFRADQLEGPWSQPAPVAPLGTRTFNSQSGSTLRIAGSKRTTYLYLGDQWDSFELWDSRYIWLPLTIGDGSGNSNSNNRALSLEWHDVYDLDVTTGEWTAVEGTTYSATGNSNGSSSAGGGDGGGSVILTGNAYLQEASFATDGQIVTGIYGNDSTVTFTGIQGSGKAQWVAFYYQNADDMGFGDNPGGTPDRIGGSFQLRRISSVVVNNNEAVVGQTLVQKDSNKGVLLSTPLLLTLDRGTNNTITVGGLSNGFDVKGADLDRIVVYPPEEE